MQRILMCGLSLHARSQKVNLGNQGSPVSFSQAELLSWSGVTQGRLFRRTCRIRPLELHG